MEQPSEKERVRTIRTKVGNISKNNCYRQELEMYFFHPKPGWIISKDSIVR
jgi:hypothetical protein